MLLAPCIPTFLPRRAAGSSGGQQGRAAVAEGSSGGGQQRREAAEGRRSGQSRASRITTYQILFKQSEPVFLQNRQDSCLHIASGGGSRGAVLFAAVVHICNRFIAAGRGCRSGVLCGHHGYTNAVLLRVDPGLFLLALHYRNFGSEGCTISPGTKRRRE
jgi:hypothetical protein